MAMKKQMRRKSRQTGSQTGYLLVCVEDTSFFTLSSYASKSRN